MGKPNADGGRSQASLGVLVLSRPGKPVQRYHLTKPVISVGRSEGMILRIPSAEISRKHCVLTFKAGFWQVQDQGSSNGTFVNGTRVGGITQVNPGSKFRVGKVEFVLQYTLQADAARRLRQGQLLEALATPAQDQDEVEMVELDDMPDGMNQEPIMAVIPLEDDLVLELEEEPIPVMPLPPANAVTMRDEPLLNLLPEEDDFPPIPVVAENSKRAKAPPPIPEPDWNDQQPPLADLRDLLSQLAEPDFEPPKGKPSGSKAKG